MKIHLLAAAALLAVTPAAALAQAHDMSAMQMTPAPAKSGDGVGEVKSVDAKAGKVTLHHGPVASLGWPAMTMSFKAAPQLLQGLKAGQKVKFTAKDGETPVITAIQRQ